jgi:hypothetical protein
MADITQLKTNVRIRVDGTNVVHIERLEAGQWISGTRFFSASSSSSSSSSFSTSSSSSS